jgi:hypothetical protein
MDKTETNIAIAQLAIDLLKIAEANQGTNRFDGLSPEIGFNSSPVQAFDAIYKHLHLSLLTAE